jgi:hypothetical protein
MIAALMLARQLGRHADELRAATTDAELLDAVSLAFGTPYGGSFTEEGWLDYKGSYRGGDAVRAPWCRYSADGGATWTEYKGKALAALVRSIIGTESQGELFAGASSELVA